MKIEIDDVLFARGLARLRADGHLNCSEEELVNFLKYNSEVVLRVGVTTFFDRWLEILEEAERRTQTS